MDLGVLLVHVFNIWLIAFPNSSEFGNAPNGFLTEEFSSFSVMHSICGQLSTQSLSDSMLLMWRLTSLFTLSTVPFSSLEYSIVP